MHEHDERQPDEQDDAMPRIKPRRIDSAHIGPAGWAAPREEVPAQVAAGQQAISADDGAPVFHELPAVESASAGQEAATADDPQQQADQLAEALAEQLRQLDDREAALIARATELADEWEACKTWHGQRLAELAAREADIDRRGAEMDAFARRQEEFSERMRDCDAQELALDQREASLNEREASLVAADHELRSRRQEVEREAAAMARSQQLFQQSQERDRQALERERRQLQADLDEQLARRLATLEAEQMTLTEHARGIEAERQSLRREQDAWRRQRQQDDQRQQTDLEAIRDDAERRLAAVAGRESALDTQQAALEQLRSEILAAHRQALEMRLIAEQLWAQIKGLMTPAEITQSLAQLRLKMTEQYELEERALAERKEELLALADKLAQQHATLKAQRMEFLAWRKSQQEEIAQQAEHLCRRVQDLSEERQRLRAA